MDKISILLSTRGRPLKLQTCLNSIYETTKDFKNIEFVIGVDEDDLEEQKVINDFIERYRDCFKYQIFIFKQPYFLNDKFNYLGQHASNNLLLAVSNDLTFKTTGWDEIIINEFNKVPEDKIFMMWLNDGIGSEQLPRHYVIHKNWMNVAGNYSQNALIHYYSDNWIYEVALRVNRLKYLENVRIDQSSPYITQKQEDYDDLIKKDTNLYFAIDNHTFINTQKYRDYEVQLLTKYIKDYK